MEEVKITWQTLTIIGVFCGAIVGLVKIIANDIRDSVKKLVDVTNDHTTVIAVEQTRNDGQDDRLDKHEDEIDNLKERVYQVTYRKGA